MKLQAKLSLIAEDGIPVDALNVFNLKWRLRAPWGIFQAGVAVHPRYWGIKPDGGVDLLATIGDSVALHVLPMKDLFSVIGPAEEGKL